MSKQSKSRKSEKVFDEDKKFKIRKYNFISS